MNIEGVQIDLEKFLPKLGITGITVTGDELLAECPWQLHKSGGRKKFYVNSRTGLWICQACKDRKGSLVKLVVLLKDCSFEEAVEYIKDSGSEFDFDTFGQQIAETLYEEIKPIRAREDRKVIRESKKILSASRRFPRTGYWAKRGYLERTIRHWNLRILKGSRWPNVIPVSIDGEEKYVVRRANKKNIKVKYLYQRGFPRKEILFGLDKAESSTLVLCEGPLDAISLWQHLDAAGALDKFSPAAIFGSSISDEQVRLVHRNADKVILFFDNDTDGEAAAESAGWKIRNVSVEQVSYGEVFAKDPGDLTTKQVMKMLRNAEPVISSRVRKKTRGA